MDYSNIQEIETVSRASPKEFDKEVNSLLNGGWIILRLFEIPESEDLEHHYSAQLYLPRENIRTVI